MNFPDETPLNQLTNIDVFLHYGDIQIGIIEDVYFVEGIGHGLANETGIYFRNLLVKNVGDLKKVFKLFTGKELKPKVNGN
jgi:hypothetical protein